MGGVAVCVWGGINVCMGCVGGVVVVVVIVAVVCLLFVKCNDNMYGQLLV